MAEFDQAHRGSTSGRFIDAFKRLEVLGKGAFSTVYKCQRVTDGDFFAVKVLDLRPLRLRANFDRKRLMRETSIMRHIEHPNVIRLLEVYEEDDHVLLVMELADGVELFDSILARDYYSEEDAKPIFTQICKALEFLHAKQIVHRDIKPENIIVTSDGLVKILDFGLAKATSSEFGSTAKTFVGTPSYLAPEVESVRSDGGSSYGVEVDCWSLGAVLYVMLVARFPEFDRCTGEPLVLFQKPLWGHVSEDAKDLIRKLMEPDPQARLTAEQALRHPWVLGRPKVNTSAQKTSGEGTEPPLPPAQGAEMGVTTTEKALVPVQRVDHRAGPLGTTLPSSPLLAQQRKVCELFEVLVRDPTLSVVVQDDAENARALMSGTTHFLQRLFVISTNILESLDDVSLAVAEDEPALAHRFFTTQRKWITKLRDEMRQTRSQNEALLRSVTDLISNRKMAASAQSRRPSSPTSPRSMLPPASREGTREENTTLLQMRHEPILTAVERPISLPLSPPSPTRSFALEHGSQQYKSSDSDYTS